MEAFNGEGGHSWKMGVNLLSDMTGNEVENFFHIKD